jgi:hypothetical protein
MGANRCINDHNTQGICSYGREHRLFGWMRYEFYCNTCKKCRILLKIWFNLPRLKHNALREGNESVEELEKILEAAKKGIKEG